MSWKCDLPSGPVSMRMIAMWPPRGPTDTAPDAVRQDRPAEAATMAALASWLAADGDGTTEKNDQIQARAAQAASAEAQGRARLVGDLIGRVSGPADLS